MRAGFVALALAYLMSQFFRAFLAVLAPLLSADIGASAEDLAFASGIWFAVFAGLQLPVGHALDTLGPRRTAGGLFLLAGVGSGVFALAQGPVAVAVAMALIGAGCAPVLMASFYIFARIFPPRVFASLGGLLIGVASAGNVAAAAPMAWAAEAFGWRACLWALAAVSLAIAAAVLAFVRDPARAEVAPGEDGGFRAVLRSPALLFVLPLTFVHYAPVGGIRGLWAGPYLADVFGLNPVQIGNVTLAMGLAMIVGNFAYGPLDRLLGTRKGGLLAGNLLLAACLAALAVWPAAGIWPAALLLCAVGFFGSSFPLMIAHGRSFFPPHLAGRGVTFLNFLAIGGAGLAQIGTGWLHGAVKAAVPGHPEAPYSAIFQGFALSVLAGCAVYAFARDRTD